MAEAVDVDAGCGEREVDTAPSVVTDRETAKPSEPCQGSVRFAPTPPEPLLAIDAPSGDPWEDAAGTTLLRASPIKIALIGVELDTSKSPLVTLTTS